MPKGIPCARLSRMPANQKTLLLHDDAEALMLIERIKQKIEKQERGEKVSEVIERDS